MWQRVCCAATLFIQQSSTASDTDSSLVIGTDTAKATARETEQSFAQDGRCRSPSSYVLRTCSHDCSQCNSAKKSINISMCCQEVESVVESPNPGRDKLLLLRWLHEVVDA